MLLLWLTLPKFCASPKFIAVIKDFHTDMHVTALLVGFPRSTFSAVVGVKRGYASPLVIFNLFIVAAVLPLY